MPKIFQSDPPAMRKIGYLSEFGTHLLKGSPRDLVPTLLEKILPPTLPIGQMGIRESKSFSREGAREPLETH